MDMIRVNATAIAAAGYGRVPIAQLPGPLQNELKLRLQAGEAIPQRRSCQTIERGSAAGRTAVSPGVGVLRPMADIAPPRLPEPSGAGCLGEAGAQQIQPNPT